MTFTHIVKSYPPKYVDTIDTIDDHVLNTLKVVKYGIKYVY